MLVRYACKEGRQGAQIAGYYVGLAATAARGGGGKTPVHVCNALMHGDAMY